MVASPSFSDLIFHYFVSVSFDEAWRTVALETYIDPLPPTRCLHELIYLGNETAKRSGRRVNTLPPELPQPFHGAQQGK